MNLSFAIISGFTVGAAVAAFALRNLVHSALCLALSLVGLAMIYLGLDAEFAGWVQILVYVGAVSILIVFAILLTHGAEPPAGRIAFGPVSGVLVGVAVFVVLARAILQSPAVNAPVLLKPAAELPPVKDIGGQLIGQYVLPLQVIGLLLTAALLGAVIIAMQERKPK